MLLSVVSKALWASKFQLKQSCIAVTAIKKVNFAQSCSFHNSPVRRTETDEDNEEGQRTNTPSEKTINQVTLLGRVGNDPIRRGSSEHPVVMFSLATHSNYAYPSGEVVKKTEWHKISIFKPSLRELACNYVTRGQRILIQGRLIYGEVKDTEGQSRQTCTIVADDIICFKKTEQ